MATCPGRAAGRGPKVGRRVDVAPAVGPPRFKGLFGSETNGDRHATAQRFPEADQIRFRGGPGEEAEAGPPAAGLDLVHDQQNLAGGANLAELAKVPDKFIHAPWNMPPLEQQLAGCVIGKDYPAPIVDHDVARHEALALYKSV